MHSAMQQFAAVRTVSGRTIKLTVKVAIAVGGARRLLTGDPAIQVIDVLAGATMDRLAAAEHLAAAAETVLDPAALASLRGRVRIGTLREGEAGRPYGVVEGLDVTVEPVPWPALPQNAIGEDSYRQWLIPPVYERLRVGQGEFLAELRPAAALFMRFSGIDYDADPQAGEKLDGYIRDVQHILARYDGTLIQLTLGDKGSYLYAAFGAPIAHEDDAQRAAAAALDLRTMSRCSTLACNPQIGLTKGRMRTGAYGSSACRTYGVLGDAVNLSARLMGAAAPGQIIATSALRKLTGDALSWESLPDVKVKGKTAPVQIALLTGAKETHTLRLQEPAYDLPMVGREAELASIEAKMRLALSGRGQVVGITGDAGMGKSRLVAEAIARASWSGMRGYGGECQSYGSHASYLVWQSVWRDLLGVDGIRCLNDQVQALADKLERLAPALLPRLPLLGPVLNLPIPDNELTGSLDGKLRKAGLERLLVDCLRAEAKQGPLFIVLEDCHWLDPLSADLVVELARALVDMPVLLLLAYRLPEPGGPVSGEVRELSHFTEISLAGFTPAEAEQLIRLKLEQVFGRLDKAPAGLAARLAQNAEGNPFYIEELVNYIQSKGIAPTDTERLLALDLPDSLQSLVLSRINQLAENPRAILRVASVVGRAFRAAVLWDIRPQLGNRAGAGRPRRPAARRSHGGGQRARTDLPVQARPDPGSGVREPAVCHTGGPSRGHRAALRERVPGEPRPVPRPARTPLRPQRQPLKRCLYLRKAGEAAQARYANTTATSYYRRVLPVLAPAEQVPVMLKLGKVLEAAGEWQAAAEEYAATQRLAEQLGDRASVAWAETWSGELHRNRGDYAEASRWLAQARAGFEALGDEAGTAQALHFSGSVASQQGNARRARALYGESLAIRRRLGDKLGIASLLNNLAIVADNEGDHQTAHNYLEQALAIRQETGNKWLIAISLSNLGGVAYYQEDYRNAHAWLEEALALFRQFGDPWNLANSLNNLGNVAHEEGQCEEARTLSARAWTCSGG